jgi:hypothetical protein
VSRINWFEMAAQLQAWQQFCDDEMVNYELRYCEADGLWEMETSSCVANYDKAYVKKASSPVQAIEWIEEIFQNRHIELVLARSMGPFRPPQEHKLTPEQLASAKATDRALRTRVQCEVQPYSSRSCTRGTKGCEFYHQN